MSDHVCGFLFSDGICRTPGVLLLRLDRPPAVQGMLTGISGRITGFETPLAALARSCRDLTGLTVDDWHPVAVVADDARTLHVFETWVCRSQFRAARQRGDQVLVRLDLADLWRARVLDDVRLLIPLALDRHSLVRPVRLMRAPPSPRPEPTGPTVSTEAMLQAVNAAGPAG